MTSLIAGALLTAGISAWDAIAPGSVSRFLKLPFGALALMANVHQPSRLIGFGSMFVFWTALTFAVLTIFNARQRSG